MKKLFFNKNGSFREIAGCTLALFLTLNLIGVQKIYASYPAAERQVGIFYFTNYGHDYYEGSMAPSGDSWVMNGQSPAFGPTGSGNFWGKPLWAATHTTGKIKDNYIFYFNKDTTQVNSDLIDWHADLIKNANIDFIVLDFTNRLVDYGGGPSYYSAAKALCKRYQQRLALGLATPKIVFWIRNASDLAIAESDFFPKYNSNIFYNYLGKKLLLVADPLGNDVVNDPNQPAVPTNGNYANYTTRHCFWNMSDALEGTCWQFKDLDATPPAAFYYNGQPEEMCAPVANQGCSNGVASGPGRQNGAFFLAYMAAAKNIGPKFLFIHSFNEWTAGNYSTSNPQVTPSFVDQWGTEGSSDIEPKLGNYALGNCAIYYELAKEQIAEFKQSPMVLGPYNVYAAGIPGVIEAENYDYGGEGVAYHDNDAANQGSVYRNVINAVDIQAASSDEGGFDVGWTNSGEWLKYSVSIGVTGTYTISTRVASPNTGGSFRIEIDGVDKTGTLVVPNTGGYQMWQDVNKTSVSLTSGKHVMRFYIVSGGFNVSKFKFALNQTTVPDGVYKLVSGNAGKCLDVAGASTEKDANIQQYSDNATTSQMWKITNLNNGYYKLSSVVSNFTCCLDVAGGSTADGANVDQYTDNGTYAQQWEITNLNNGFYRLTARCSGKCLDVEDGSTGDGANVQQYTSNGSAAQQWRLTWVTGTGVTLRSAHAIQEEVEESISEKKVSVYPNPAVNIVTISGISEDSRVSILDLQGKALFSEKSFSDLQINVSVFKEGLYIVNIGNANTSENKKLIIKR